MPKTKKPDGWLLLLYNYPYGIYKTKKEAELVGKQLAKDEFMNGTYDTICLLNSFKFGNKLKF